MTGQIVITAAGARPPRRPRPPRPRRPSRHGARGHPGDRPGHGRHPGHRHPPGPGHRPPPAPPPGASGAVPASGNLPLFVSLAIHIPAAVAWLGVVLYQAVVAAVPYLSVSQRADLLRRPRWLILAVIPLFAITGTYQTINNPFVTITDFETAEAFRATSAYAQALFWKHGFVLLSMALTLAVTFWLAPRLAQSAAPVAIAPGRRPGGHDGHRRRRG